MATISVNVGGTWQTLKTVAVNVGGTWVNLKSVWVNVSGTWRQVFASLSATASPTSVSGTGASSSNTIVTSGATTVTAVGGVPGYTYSWSLVSGTAMLLSNATGPTTTFHLGLSGTITVTAVYRCTVSDAAGNQATADVSVSLRHSTGT